MIGGQDITIATVAEPPLALRIAARAILNRWPHAVFQLADTDPDDAMAFHDLALADARELFVYQDTEAMQLWSRYGASPRTRNTLVHVIAEAGALTLVVDDARTRPVSALLAELTRLLQQQYLWAWPQEAAA